MRDTPCAARGAEPLAFLLVLGGGALRGGWTSLLRWVAEDRRAADREEKSSLKQMNHRDILGLESELLEWRRSEVGA